ncbi:MAG: hypothetical protein ABSF70_08730 [Terracidiphilus sp.]|jgi:hypothetical protein
MKLPPIAKIRILILLALAACEAVGLHYFYGQRGFAQFAVFSLQGIFIIALPLWFNSLRQRGVPGFDIIIATIAGASAIGGSGIALNVWARGDRADALASVGVSIFIAATILFKLVRPRHSSIIREAILFFAYAILVMWMRVRNASALWMVLVTLPSLWFLWRAMFHIRNWQRTTGDA